MAERIQLSRRRGWRLPAGAVNVARPTRWGNPYHWKDYARDYRDADRSELRRMAVSDFRGMIEGRWDGPPGVDYPVGQIGSLIGLDLACWCPPDHACHADVLLAEAARLEAAETRERTEDGQP